MTFLSRLDVINEMLALMGEAPLSAADEGHPLYPQADRKIDTASYRVQARGWWFNNELVVLHPDAATGHIVLPANTIRVDPREPSLNYVQRGRRLYHAFGSAAQDKYKFASKVQCWLVRHVPFDELPVTAQLAVSYMAQTDFQRDYDADSFKFQQIKLARDEAMIALNTEHIRNVNANLLETPSVQAVMNRVSPLGRWRTSHLDRIGG